MTSKARAKVVDELIRKIWVSLESHLDYTYKKLNSKTDGSNAFQKECVRDYAAMIVLATKLY